jgi:hypothetical protein
MDWATSTATTPLPRKRPATDEAPHQRLSKRLSLLTLRPPSPSSPSKPRKKKHLASTKPAEERMEVDHVVFIDNLSDYDTSSDEEEGEGGLLFVPDIEKKLNAIPKSLLMPKRDEEDEGKGMELVLYQVPQSLSVSGDEDGVRKVVMESRERMRRERLEASMSGMIGTIAAGLGGMGELQGVAAGGSTPAAVIQNGLANGGLQNGVANGLYGDVAVADDPDAMDIEI